eukprot:1161077-Amphidinium_carterae.1
MPHCSATCPGKKVVERVLFGYGPALEGWVKLVKPGKEAMGCPSEEVLLKPITIAYKMKVQRTVGAIRGNKDLEFPN